MKEKKYGYQKYKRILRARKLFKIERFINKNVVYLREKGGISSIKWNRITYGPVLTYYLWNVEWARLSKPKLTVWLTSACGVPDHLINQSNGFEGVSFMCHFISSFSIIKQIRCKCYLCITWGIIMEWLLIIHLSAIFPFK